METQGLTELEHNILEQLELRGYEYPVGREDLAGRMRWRRLITGSDDRAMRGAIESLRKKGYLICHRKGKGGGYYLARSKAEYEDFRIREYKSRIISLADTMREMDKSAEMQFGEEIQLDLFKI